MPKMTPRHTAQENAQHYFTQTDPQSDTPAQKLRVAAAANTARLRELRLAKEAAEKQAHEAAGIDPEQRKPVRKLKSVVRMSY